MWLIYKEIQMGSVAKSYIRKGFLIYEEMRKYLTIYDFATDPSLISLYMRKIWFSIVSVYVAQILYKFQFQLQVRVQWFWHFFRNSICFMCFWFGLQILRLVYKKVFFEISNSFYLIWPFILRKIAPPLLRDEKKNSSKLGVRGIKNSASFDTLHAQFRRNFFSTLIRGCTFFFEG